MDADAKKTALRMIPYGIYVLTAEAPDGAIAAATVNWVTQSTFAPPLIVIGVKSDSGAYAVLGKTAHFALKMLGKGQQAVAFKFFKPAEKQGNTISGDAYRKGLTGAPILAAAPAATECKLAEIVKRGDYHIVIGEVVEASVATPPTGRTAAAATLAGHSRIRECRRNRARPVAVQSGRQRPGRRAPDDRAYSRSRAERREFRIRNHLRRSRARAAAAPVPRRRLPSNVTVFVAAFAASGPRACGSTGPRRRA